MAFLIPSIQFLFGLPRALIRFGVHFDALQKCNKPNKSHIVGQLLNSIILKLVYISNDIRHVSANHVTVFVVVKYYFTFLKMER